MAASAAQVVLKTVKSISVRFCPFESNVRATREFLYAVSSSRARSSNINCDVTVDVKHDKSEPVINIIFGDGDRLVMKGAHLTTGEMLSAFNSRCIAKNQKVEEGTKK
ncbi:large ribosomal subunit protein mL53 [Microcaecilia unicolor]|uniref:Large ribosomal subunit protein mL53 n=1 Tax=Microcaecilia unicolor TaxID=1415580 RepID=A0A6P7X642_9AMPH|nr:39S ribosomal protein L53, mitochondrial [Microcaecilia unicolor]